jgi:hypothetical protein
MIGSSQHCHKEGAKMKLQNVALPRQGRKIEEVGLKGLHNFCF